MDKYENKHVKRTEIKLAKKGSQITHERMLPIYFQGQMTMINLTMDKYRNNIVGIIDV